MPSLTFQYIFTPKGKNFGTFLCDEYYVASSANVTEKLTKIFANNTKCT